MHDSQPGLLHLQVSTMDPLKLKQTCTLMPKDKTCSAKDKRAVYLSGHLEKTSWSCTCKSVVVVCKI